MFNPNRRMSRYDSSKIHGNNKAMVFIKVGGICAMWPQSPSVGNQFHEDTAIPNEKPKVKKRINPAIRSKVLSFIPGANQ
jgi:hypothetical protein